MVRDVGKGLREVWGGVRGEKRVSSEETESEVGKDERREGRVITN